MNLIITGRNFDVNEHIKGFIEKKLQKIAHHWSKMDEVRAELSVNKTKATMDHYTCQLTVHGRKNTLRAEETMAEMYDAIEKAISVIGRQLERVEGRRKKRKHHASLGETAAAIIAANGEEKDAVAIGIGEIVRRKRFLAEPMNAEEAIDQMELLGHGFFLFLEPDEHAIHLVYRRQDGNYGLLQPEVG